MNFEPLKQDVYGFYINENGEALPSEACVTITKETYDQFLIQKKSIDDRSIFQEGFNSGKQVSLYDYHQKLVQEIIDYEEGCEEGKVRFIEYLGLEEYLPSNTLTVTFQIDVGYCSEDSMSSVENDVAYELNRMNLDRGYVSEYSISYDWD